MSTQQPAHQIHQGSGMHLTEDLREKKMPGRGSHGDHPANTNGLRCRSHQASNTSSRRPNLIGDLHLHGIREVPTLISIFTQPAKAQATSVAAPDHHRCRLSGNERIKRALSLGNDSLGESRSDVTLINGRTDLCDCSTRFFDSPALSNPVWLVSLPRLGAARDGRRGVVGDKSTEAQAKYIAPLP